MYLEKVKFSHTRYRVASVGPGADSGVQAVSLQVTLSHPQRYAAITFNQACVYLISANQMAPLLIEVANI